MIVTPVKTDKLLAGQKPLTQFLSEVLIDIKESSVVAVTSKVVALCENRIVPIGKINKEKLIIQESQYYLPDSKLGHRTIAHNTLISGSGIDESNSNGNYVLLPEDPQKSANQIREYLSKKFNLANLGVIITDSVSMPLRLGASGICLGWSGFEALYDHRGELDLFGRPFEVSRVDMATGLAAAAVLVMGEGAEQTPIALITEVPFITFQQRDPTKQELEYNNLPMKEDIFSPLLNSMDWQKGGQSFREVV